MKKLFIGSIIGSGIFFGSTVLIGGGLILSAASMLLTSCVPSNCHPRFEKGSMVKVVITGDIGMVLESSYNAGEYVYKVRLPNKQIKTDMRMLTYDQPLTLSLLPIVEMKEYELMKSDAVCDR